MERYIQQLLGDIEAARAAVPTPWIDLEDEDEDDFLSPTEEIRFAPRKSLEEWTGLRKIQLPPANRLNQVQIRRLLQALKDMLSAYNCHVVFQRAGVPEQVQYAIIRSRFDQESPLLRSDDHFFSFCDPGQNQADCQLGPYCECLFLEQFLTQPEEGEWGSGFDEEVDLPEAYLTRKYDRGWDTSGLPPDWEEEEEDFSEEEDDDWWDEEEEDW